MSAAGKKFRYIENVVLEDWGLDLPTLVAAIALAHGRPPPTRSRPFTAFNEWKRKVATTLCESAPEASRVACFGYTPILVTYIVRAYFNSNQRLDNYYHEQAIYQIKAVRRRVRVQQN